MNNNFNCRILVIDDEESVRDSICNILTPSDNENQSLLSAGNALFGDDTAETKTVATSTTSQSSNFEFQLTLACNGQEGLDKIKESLRTNQHFAAVFCDMRMPGWDGLTTIQEIRKLDKNIQATFLTAYSDYQIEEIAEKAGADIGYICKPFSYEELKQAATKNIYEWNIQHLQQEKEKQEKISMLGRAVAMITHDLRSPLGSCMSAANIIKETEESLSEKSILMLDTIKDGCEDGLAMVEDILDYTKSKEIITQLCATDDLAQAVKSYADPIFKNSTIIFDLDYDSGIVDIDLRKMNRVLLNLIKNAKEALQKTENAKISLSIKEEQDSFLISVSDNGPGIPESIHKTLFEPFVTKNKAGGTGLGLAIVQQLISAHKSELHFSTSPEGTRFYFKLPKVEL